MTEMDCRGQRTSSGGTFFRSATWIRVKHLPDLSCVTQRGSHYQIVGGPPHHEESGDLPAAIWPASTPDRQVDCLKIPPLTAGETAWGPLKGVHIGATIQEQRYRLGRASPNRPMERRGARGVTEIDKVRIRIEQLTDFVHGAPCRRRVNLMIGGLRADDAAAIHCLFESSSDLGIAPFARHLDQATVV